MELYGEIVPKKTGKEEVEQILRRNHILYIDNTRSREYSMLIWRTASEEMIGRSAEYLAPLLKRGYIASDACKYSFAGNNIQEKN